MNIRKLIASKKGFTLIELMIVVAIIGILAAIAIPQFAQLIAKSQEGATKGNLGSIRSALSIYYGDTEGFYPAGAAALNNLTISSKYLSIVPNANLPHTTRSIGHTTNAGVAEGDLSQTATITDSNGGTQNWAYDNTGPSGPAWGSIVVNCTHTDVRGTIWTAL